MTNPHPPNRTVASLGGLIGVLLGLFFVVAGVLLIADMQHMTVTPDSRIAAKLTLYTTIIFLAGALLFGAGITAAKGLPLGCIIGCIVCIAVFAFTMLGKHNPTGYGWALLPEAAYILMFKDSSIVPTMVNGILVTLGVGALLFGCGIFQTINYRSWQSALYARALPHSRFISRAAERAEPTQPGSSENAIGSQGATDQPVPGPSEASSDDTGEDAS
jgi:hypothetical protein